MRTVLLLAGTAEAREFARRFRGQDIRLVASLAGVTTAPLAYPCETRVGGFGGADAMVKWLRDKKVIAIVDATHPFAEQISINAVEAAQAAEVPLLAMRRAPWDLPEASRVYENVDALAAALPTAAKVFLTSGRSDVEAFAERKDVSFLLRSIEPVEGLPAHIESMVSRPPFSLEDEVALMRDRAITHLVTKNSGGAKPAKLIAADELGIEILSVAMPLPPDGATVVDSVDGALDWVGKQIVECRRC
jgi:precorrin-6A/cobalt-precorrin-6A reductase